jgi:hypothetical protein
MAGRPEVFAALKGLLTPLSGRLAVTANTATTYGLDVPGYRYRDKATAPFAWVKDGKSYVSFHIFPVYVMPDLLDGLSDPLRRRMQGKSCFNFKTLEPDLFAELRMLVDQAEPRFRAELERRRRPAA